jgi:hypothetical protein
VLFDHSVPDRDTGEPRQCDVWINAKFGDHWPLAILVSCKDHKRKLHVGDIGTFCDEKRSTGADMGVIYSRTGFTKTALSKAKANRISCCRIYRNEPSDLPATICFDQFLCKTGVQMLLQTDLRKSEYKTWNDLFAITINSDNESQTVLDVLVSAFDEGEKWSLSEWREPTSERKKVFPPDWQAEIRFNDQKKENSICILLMGLWKKYRAPIEAILVNGSYCVSDSSFKGDMVGPSIDTQGDHPGKDWVEITNMGTELNSQGSRVVMSLYHGNIKSTLKEKLGLESLYP